MPKRRYFKPTNEETAKLEQIRDKHPKAYMREKAAALLKIAAGQSPHQVALKGLLKRRDPDTIYGWLERYEAEGVEGLLVREGRGRKPTSSP